MEHCKQFFQSPFPTHYPLPTSPPLIPPPPPPPPTLLSNSTSCVRLCSWGRESTSHPPPFPTSHLPFTLSSTPAVRLSAVGEGGVPTTPLPPFFSFLPAFPPPLYPPPYLPPLLTSISCGSLRSGRRGSTSRMGRCLLRVLMISREPP